jgi:Rrf2 family protein
MRIVSNKSKYALSTMLELALANKTTTIQSKQIAQKRNIPIKFLEHILSDLRQTGLVTSKRGSQGGYQLAKPSVDITVNDIISAIEGPLALSDSHCGCILLTEFWQTVESRITNTLSLSLADLVLQQQKKEKVVTYDI